MKLKVKGWYASRQAAYRPGDEIEVDEDYGKFLLRDAPDCFEVMKKQVKAPAKDKAVKSPARAKAKK